jgi:uncharacterized membrane protein YoaK (UPF0700 family)
MTEKPVEKTQRRIFGFLIGGGLAVIGLALISFGGDWRWEWRLVMGVALFATGLILPQILRPAFRAWTALGEFIPRVNTRLVMTLLFYIVFVPIGFVLRIARKDLMQRRFDPKAETYRVPRTKRPASHMQRQY